MALRTILLESKRTCGELDQTVWGDRNRMTLLTGSTGLLGQFLLADLLRARCPVAVLVRSNRSGSAIERVEQILNRFELGTGRRFERPTILEGDLTQPDLGLNDQQRLWVSRNCRSIIHSAANLSFKPASEHPDNEPFRTNVDGTRELIRFALEAGIQEFHDVSSAYVCGLRAGRILENEGWLGQAFSNDYEQSKLTAEQLTHSVGFQQVTVYRPSIVVDTTPGSLLLGDRTIYYAFNVLKLLTQRFGEINLQDLCESLRITGEERKNIVDVRWIARTIVQIFRRPDLHGTTYHLTNPEGTRLRDLLVAFQEELRPSRGRESAPRRPSEGWGELSEIVEQFVETFTPYFRDDPIFDQTNLIRALERCGEPNCPPVTPLTLKELARQQMVSAPQAKRQAGKSLTRWRQWLDQVLPATFLNSDHVQGLQLTLSGAEGGSWCCRWSENDLGDLVVEPGLSEEGLPHFYLTADCWEQILSGTVGVDRELESGRILLETEGNTAGIAALVRLVEVVRTQSRGGENLSLSLRESGVYGH